MQQGTSKMTVSDVYKRITPEQVEELKVLTYNFIMFNDVVCMEIVRMIDSIKECGMYVHATKMLVNHVDKMRKHYESKMSYVMKGVLDLFFNINSAYEDLFIEDFEKLRKTIKTNLDKIGVHDSTAKASIKSMELIVQLANEQYKKNTEKIYGTNILPRCVSLDYLDISDIRIAIQRLSERFMVPVEGVDDILSSIRVKLSDSEAINKILKENDRSERDC